MDHPLIIQTPIVVLSSMVTKVRARKHKQERRFGRIIGDRVELNLDQPINSRWEPIESLLTESLQKTRIQTDLICLVSSHIEAWQVTYKAALSVAGFFSLNIQSLGSQEEMGYFTVKKLSGVVSEITKRQSTEISAFPKKRSFSQLLTDRQCDIIMRGDKSEACKIAKAIITKTIE